MKDPTEVPIMISAITERIVLRVLLAASLTATSACSLITDLRSAPREPALRVVQVPAPRSAPSDAATTPASELRPVSSVDPGTPVPAAQLPPQTSAPDVERVMSDDPRAVIDWLLNRSSTR